jgi:hypothetical protein
MDHLELSRQTKAVRRKKKSKRQSPTEIARATILGGMAKRRT